MVAFSSQACISIGEGWANHSLPVISLSTTPPPPTHTHTLFVVGFEELRSCASVSLFLFFFFSFFTVLGQD